MATLRWRGDAVAIAQVDTLTVGGTVEVGDLFNTTINGKTLSHAATSTSTTTTATGIATDWNALSSTTNPEHAEATAAGVAATVTITADVKGKPFTLTVATTEAGGGAADLQTFTRAATTASVGPNDWSSARNWSTNAVPVAADDVVIELNAVDILYGLNQTGITLTSLVINNNHTAKVGLKEHNGSYQEYRTTYLTIGATTQTIGRGPGTGSGRLKINNEGIATTLTVHGTGTAESTGTEAFLWKGTNIANVVNVYKGSVGVAVLAGETAAIATLRVGYTSNVLGDSFVRCSSGVTLTTINQSGGTLEINSACTTINKTAGNLTIGGSGAVTTLNEDGGTTTYNSTGTITTLNISDGGIVDFGQNMSAKTVTNCNMYAGSKLLDPFKVVTFTNAIALVRAGLAEVVIDFGQNINVQRS